MNKSGQGFDDLKAIMQLGPSDQKQRVLTYLEFERVITDRLQSGETRKRQQPRPRSPSEPSDGKET